jgi:ketosteroid isomerase-like protein
MSQANMDALRAVYDEWGRGNFKAGLDLYDPDVLLVSRRDLPDADRYLGVDSMRAYMREYLEPLENVTWTAEEFVEAENSVVVTTLQQGTGRESGLSVEARHFVVWTFRGPKAIRFEVFRDRSAALEAVGLSE